ncbi:MAG TPA: protein kinase [Polyangiaceae bacterium]|nr:protein kinase [Polyangiaceae bacterium]
MEALAGTGGMGAVYRAFDRAQGQRVALKLLAAGEASYAARFAEEARILAHLAHPGVVQWIAHGEDAGGQRWLALEWLEGEDLAARLVRGALTVEECLAVGLAAAEALAAAHAHGIVHRDIKPSNLFLVGGDPRRVKLLDFGVARRTNVTHAITRSGVVVGTPGYIAPEQVRGDPTDARADVFGLGAVLYECLAGRPAFAGGPMMAVLARLLVHEPPPLRRMRGDIPPELDALIARMLAKEPEARLADGAVVAEAIRSLCPRSFRRNATEPEGSDVFGENEQRVISVVVAAPPFGELPGDTDTAWFSRVETALARIDMRADAVTGGLLLVRSKDAGSPDQALQAARGALLLRSLLEREVTEAPRIAIVTGTSEIAGRLPAGELLDRAASLLAEPALVAGAAYVDDATQALLGTRLDVHRGPAGWELHGERERGAGAGVVIDCASPFVGRERELSALMALFEECTGEGLARAVLVTGPAGIGKTRLCHEAVLRIGAMAPEVEIWTARGPMAGDAAPFGVLGSIVRQARGHVPGEVAPAFSSLAEAAVENRPLLLIVDDLQWADAPSVLAVEQALHRLQDRPLFVLALARPEVHERFPRMWVERDAQEIHLGGLAPRAAARLVHHALGEGAEPAKVAALVERADGHPFYLEELIRAAAEGRGETLPETVLSMLQARLAGLAPEERRFLRAASIFGDVFWVRGVLRVLGGGSPAVVSALVDHGLLERHPTSRLPDEEEVSFRDPLVHEAAYATLTAADRARGQAVAAAWLERVGETRGCVLK